MIIKIQFNCFSKSLPVPSITPYNQIHLEPLYKYCRLEHAEALVSKGSICIGTLRGFGDTIRYGSAVIDNDEGAYKFNMENFFAIGGHESPECKALEKLGIPISPGGIMSGGLVERTIRAKNRYIYCLSREWSRDILNRWYQEEEYNACVKIENANYFFCALNHALLRQKLVSSNVKPIIGNCQYLVNRESDIRKPTNLTENDILFTKVESNHGWQSEVRYIWEPAQKIKNKYEIFLAKEVVGFCKIHAHII